MSIGWLLEAEHCMPFVIIDKGHKKEEMSRVAKHKSQHKHKDHTF